jgi:hypothetical protein
VRSEFVVFVLYGSGKLEFVLVEAVSDSRPVVPMQAQLVRFGGIS